MYLPDPAREARVPVERLALIVVAAGIETLQDDQSAQTHVRNQVERFFRGAAQIGKRPLF